MHTLIDIRTLVFVITMMLVARAIVIAFVWRNDPGYPPLRLWTWGSMLIACGTLLIGLRDHIPLWISVLLAHTLVLSGWGVFAAGTVTATGKQPHWRAMFGLIVAGMVGVGFFLLVQPDYGLRSFSALLPSILFDLYAAWFCLQPRQGRQATALRWLGVVLLVQGLSNGIKLIHVVDGHYPTVFDVHWPVLQFYILLVPSISIGTALLILLAMQRVQSELDAELELRRQHEQSLALAALVYESSSEGMIVMDPSGFITAVNPSFSRISGYAEHEILGKNLSHFRTEHQPDALSEQVITALRDKGVWQGDIWSKTRNGADYAVRLTINTIYDSQGQALHRVALFQDVTQQTLSAETIYHQANFDRLTGLANRYRFFDVLAQQLSLARRNQVQVAILFMDLNRFKPVNDQYGHDAGDVVLKTVAERWSSCLRAEDVLSRLGGDEFALVVPHVAGADEAIRIGEKLLSALQEPIVLRPELTCTIGSSVGVALYPVHGFEMDSLLAAADAAMYAAKAKGGVTPCLAAPTAPGAPDQSGWMVLEPHQLTGIREIDAEHQQIVAQINRINRALRDGSEQPLRPLFDALVALTVQHFQTEESYMARYEFTHSSEHARQHAVLIEEIQSLVSRFSQGDELRLLQSLKDWLVNHIQHSDKALGLFLTEHGVQ